MNSEEKNEREWRAVARWYHSYFTGIVLSTVTRRGRDRAAELVYEMLCRQRQQRFVPGLRKLGIDHLPHAVAAAQYHYLSNHIGGVSVEYMYENDRKAWIRYAAPRWIWSGTAICAIPTEVSRAMMLGWHSQNGVSLGNPRLGFVCTKQAVDGQSGLEGYYFEYDRDLAPHERLRFARHEDAPDFDPAAAPKLPTDTWPRSRLAKANRNYAMEYVRTAMPTAVSLWGPDDATHLLHLTGKLVGMQFYHEVAKDLGIDTQDTSAENFATFMRALGTAQDDHVEFSSSDAGTRVHQKGWRLMEGLPDLHQSLAHAWSGLLEGALAAHNHRLQLKTAIQNANASESVEFDWIINR